jgi:hypothetical protein
LEEGRPAVWAIVKLFELPIVRPKMLIHLSRHQSSRLLRVNLIHLMQDSVEARRPNTQRNLGRRQLRINAIGTRLQG